MLCRQSPTAASVSSAALKAICTARENANRPELKNAAFHFAIVFFLDGTAAAQTPLSWDVHSLFYPEHLDRGVVCYKSDPAACT